jgi:16S rRNA processing protein RimM
MTDDLAKLQVVAKITAVYGVKGWVKIHSYTDPIENFMGFRDCYLDRGDQWEPIDFESIKRHGKGLVALIEGVDDRELARTFCQHDIAVSSEEFAPLGGDDFYWHQLPGLAVYATGDNGESLLLGRVDHVMATGANDVLVVLPCRDESGTASIDDTQRLIPWIKDQVIQNVDIEAGTIQVDWDPAF